MPSSNTPSTLPSFARNSLSEQLGRQVRVCHRVQRLGNKDQVRERLSVTFDCRFSVRPAIDVVEHGSGGLLGCDSAKLVDAQRSFEPACNGVECRRPELKQLTQLGELGHPTLNWRALWRRCYGAQAFDLFHGGRQPCLSLLMAGTVRASSRDIRCLDDAQCVDRYSFTSK